MASGQKSGTGAMTNLDDSKVEKDKILSNREKSQRPPGQSLDSTGVQVDEYKDIPTNRRPEKGRVDAEEHANDEAEEKIDRPGFDLGGSSGETKAGRGLGLDDDAKEDREDWSLRRAKR